MSDEIKEILDYFKRSNKNKFNYEQDKIITYKEAQILLDYITNLQEELKSANESVTWWQNRFNALQKENERLKGIAHKMHLWIFLHSGDEQKVYDELGLTDEENAMLGYSGQFRIGGDEE